MDTKVEKTTHNAKEKVMEEEAHLRKNILNKEQQMSYKDKIEEDEEVINKMGTEPISKLMIAMGLPMILSMVVQAFYNIVDSYFVSAMPDWSRYKRPAFKNTWRRKKRNSKLCCR